MKLPHASSDDPLLFATAVLLYLVCAFLILAITLLCIALPTVGFYWHEAAAEIVKQYPNARPNSLMPAILAAIAMGIGVASLAYKFVDKLLQIIRTVGDGDPFDAANADRLQAMAWYSLAIQIIGIVMGLIVHGISKTLKETDMHYDMEFTSVILILLLFILARVFRRGAEMRSELEGTV
jgi:MFS family permease